MNSSAYYKGSLSTIILHLLSTENRMYGYEIAQKVKDLTSGEMLISEGALYPALHKMEDNGLLEAEIEYIGTRVRKYYRLTQRGVAERQNKLEELNSFIKNIQDIFESLKPSTIVS
jgi:PadR family transcriptional regulator, regulatory protein PadR